MPTSMRMGTTATIKATTTQTTRMKQRLIHSMELLQLPLQVLEEKLEYEMLTNPVLEMDDDLEGDDTVSGDQDNLHEEREGNEVSNSSDIYADSFTPDDYLAYGEIWNDGSDDMPKRSQDALEQDSERYLDMVNNIEMPKESLQDHLLEQLRWFDCPENIRDRAEEIINNLDHSGFFPHTLENFFDPNMTPEELEELEDTVCNITEQKARSNITPEELKESEEALRLVQMFDPKGVGARDFKECLLLQLKKGMPYEQEIRYFIENHLDDIIKFSIPQIAKKTGYSPENVAKIIEEIRKLNPNPGSVFEPRKNGVIRPDVYVEKMDDGTWNIQLADSRAYHVHLNPYYLRMIHEKTLDKDARKYLHNKILSAQELVDLVHQRKLTLYSVASAIVEHQKDFLENGPEYIHPLILKQIADKVGVNASTVSRACGNKWLQSPQGILPFKRFFSVSRDGDMTQDAVRLKLRNMIDTEDKKNPLSDEEIVKIFVKEGMKISRRAITKYRLSMDIPNSRQRRDWK